MNAVWPFAITRAVTAGFQVVVAPGFLVEHDAHYLLADAAGGEVSQDNAYLREFRDRDGRRLWLLYRVVHLKGSDVGRQGEYAMHGARRTLLVEGAVCTERPGGATEGLFARVRRACADPVREFFVEDSESYQVHKSEPIAVEPGGTPVRTVEQPAYRSERNLQTALAGCRPGPRERASDAAVPAAAATDAAVRGDGGGRVVVPAAPEKDGDRAWQVALAACATSVLLAVALIVTILR